ARNGRSVTVVEANDTIGGGCRSAELTLPGFVHDLCSAFHPMGAASPFFRSLELGSLGLEWIEPPLALAHPLDDGTAIVLSRSLDETARGLGSDGRAWRRLVAQLVQHWPDLATDALGPLIKIPHHPLVLARLGLPGLLSARLLARRAFVTERARALFAGLAAHSMMPLDAPLSASFGLMFAVTTHVASWPIPWRGRDCLRAGTVDLGGTLDEIGESEEDVARGRVPEHPFVLVGQQSLFDRSRGAGGEETVWAYCHVPNGSAVDMTGRIEA